MQTLIMQIIIHLISIKLIHSSNSIHTDEFNKLLSDSIAVISLPVGLPLIP